MNIDKKLEVIRKSLEKGADVEVIFHNITSEEEAKETIEKLGGMVNIPAVEGSREGTYWYKANDWQNGIKLTAFYEDGPYMEEDIFVEKLS